MAVGAALSGLRPVCEFSMSSPQTAPLTILRADHRSDLELCHAGDRPNRQLWREDVLHVRWERPMSRRVPRSQWSGCRRGRSTFPGLLSLVWKCTRAEGVESVECFGLQRAVEKRDP